MTLFMPLCWLCMTSVNPSAKKILRASHSLRWTRACSILNAGHSAVVESWRGQGDRRCVDFSFCCGRVQLGKRQYQPFTITKEIDGGSPSLFKSVCNHEVFDKLNIDFEQVDSKGLKRPYLAMNLTNVTIVGVKRKPHPGKAIDVHELEEISFAFEKIVVARKNSKSSMDDDWVAVD